MRSYHSHRSRYVPRSVTPRTEAAAISLTGLTWPQLWNHVQQNLVAKGTSTGTLKTYRHVLRSFSRWFYSTPERVTASAAKAYILKLTDRHCSWSWTSTNISVLRAVFDHLAGLSVCSALVTPKRPKHLPETLSRADILRLLTTPETPRDQLLLSLMYGCGLKVSEVCALKWANVDCSQMELTIRHGVAAGTAPRSRSGMASDARQVAFSSQLLPLLAKGRSICLPDDYIFRGSKVGDHLSIGATSPLEALADGSGKADALAPAVPEPGRPEVLPFEPLSISIGDRASLFYRSLKLHIRWRFMALRNAINTT